VRQTCQNPTGLGLIGFIACRKKIHCSQGSSRMPRNQPLWVTSTSDHGMSYDVMGISLHLDFGAKFWRLCGASSKVTISSGEHVFFIGTSTITNGNRDFRLVAYPRHIPLMSCFSTPSFCHRPNFSNKKCLQLLNRYGFRTRRWMHFLAPPQGFAGFLRLVNSGELVKIEKSLNIAYYRWLL